MLGHRGGRETVIGLVLPAWLTMDRCMEREPHKAWGHGKSSRGTQTAGGSHAATGDDELPRPCPDG